MKKGILELKKIAANRKVLIVEDDIVLNAELSNTLEMFFGEVIVAYDGEEGLKLYKEIDDIALVLSDINMPKMDGLSMLTHIKSINKDQICLVLSAYSDLKYVLQIIDLGINQFILKPYDLDNFLLKLTTILEAIDLKDNISSQRQEIDVLNITLQRRYKLIDNHLSTTITDLNGVITYASKLFCKISGYTKGELIGKPHNIIRHPDTPSSVFENMWKTIQSGIVWEDEIKNLDKHGNPFWSASKITPEYQDGEIVGYMAIRQDITQLKKKTYELEKLNKNLDTIILEKTNKLKMQSEIVNQLVIFSQTDTKGIITDVSQAFIDLSGYTRDELVGKTHSIVSHPDYSQEFFEDMWNTIMSGMEWKGVLRNLKKDGETYIVKATISPIFEDHKIVGYYSSRIDITDQEIYRMQLEEAKNKAEESTKFKSEFLANMSHEIRTPMNGIIGMSHLALQSDLNDKQYELVEKIETSAKSLLGIINDILDFSKIEAGKLGIDKINFDLFSVIENVVTLVEPQAHAKELEIIVDYEESHGRHLFGDGLRIGQILTNLMSNAIKFTSEGEVGIYITRVSDSIMRFEVKDTGIGLTAEQQSKLFQSFSQADGSTTRKYGGTGLGLAISKQLVDLMDGKIWIESQEGQGSSFYFEIELIEQECKIEKQEYFSNKRVLVVDDNDTWQHILEHLLENYKIQVDLASSGQEALGLLTINDSSYYDLILMDWNMPKMNGIEVAKIIREKKLIGECPSIIMISAYSKETIADKAKDAGIHSFLHKPINPSHFHDMLHSVFLNGKKTENLSVVKHNVNNIKNIDSLHGVNILLVEDNIINQEIVVGLLNNSGLNIDIASNGQEAVDMFLEDQNKYKLILMDLQMPIMSGYEATKIIRTLSKDIPIVALTANAMKEDVEKTKAVGMNEHLNKPIEVDKLYNTLYKYIGEVKNTEVVTLEEASNDVYKYINKDEALKYVAGNEKLFNKILQGIMTYKDKNFEDMDDEEFAREIHTLKGLSGTMCAANLHKIVVNINDTQDRTLLPEFYKHLNDVLNEIEAI